jgi:hypothetical protein
MVYALDSIIILVTNPAQVYLEQQNFILQRLSGTNRFICQLSGKYIYLAKQMISKYYNNINETETVLAGQLKQASSIIIRI